VKKPKTITVGSKVLRNTGLTLKVRYSLPLRLRLRLAVLFARLSALCAGAKTDITPKQP
jgi:hypothetical protein